MTAEKVFDLVMGLMFSGKGEKADYQEMFFPILNLILADCFAANNCMRQQKGKEKLENIPQINKESDEIPYEEELLVKILPCGIAANLYAEDDETGITNVYRERYGNLLGAVGYAEFADAEEVI